MRNFPASYPSVRSALALLALASAPPLSAAEADVAELRAQIRALEQKLLVIERKQELRDEAAAAAAPTTPRLTVNDRGFTLSSAEGANALRLRGLVQLDSRLFFDDGGGVLNNAFVLRRARLISEGQFARNYAFQFITEFGGSSVSILDANLTATVTRELQFKIGKFKAPVGLELLQSDAWTFFNERSVATNLVPNRDLGVQAQGELFDGRLAYQAGVFNGLGDGGSTTNTDFDEEKDVAGRVIVQPCRDHASSPLQGLAFGVAASLGREKTAAGRTSAFRTDGQQSFFSYSAATVADGQSWRVSPQFDYRFGPIGAIGECVVSTVNVRPSTTGPKTELKNKAWHLAAGYVLTGEDSSYGGVVPATNFDLAAGTWGAFEVVGRYATLKVDDRTFPTFAAAATSAQEAKSWGLGLNWYLSKSTMLKIDYYQTEFGFSSLAPAVSAAPVLRQDEQAFITRFQLTF